LKKVCYEVSLCEYSQRQSCKAFTGYLSVQNGPWGMSYSTWKFGRNWPTPSEKPISTQYSLRLIRNTYAKKVRLTRISIRAFEWASMNSVGCS